MNQYIYADPSPFNITITFNFYDKRQQIVRRTFTLRNLQGSSEAAQLAHATTIMNDVAAELYYISNCGIDKGIIKLNGKKASEIIYEQYSPDVQEIHFLFGVTFHFGLGAAYHWTQNGRSAYRIPTDTYNDNWQRQILRTNKKISFNMPCMASRTPNEYFLTYGHTLKKRGQKKRWFCKYNRDDQIFTRFTNRFFENGNLALGEERAWGETPLALQLKGTFWRLPKFGETKSPRRSNLANAPVDNTEYVYLIRMGRTKFYKIGKSNDPQNRLASMQTASPHKLKLLHTFKADNATAAEEALHAALHHHRQEGEWFKLSDEQRDTITSITAYTSNHATIAGQSHKISNLFK